jgi:Uma2 family endonuclease
MRVNSTEVQNNFGKYLMLAAKEDIIITRNGIEVARLTAGESIVKHNSILSEVIREGTAAYRIDGDYGGRKATFEEFKELTRNDGDNRYEYIDGEIFCLSSPKTPHQYTLGKLFGSFHNIFANSKCTPMVAPYDITLTRYEGDINVVQPDIMIICDLKEKLGADGYYKGIPKLVVEILSETSLRMDMIKKLNLYMYSGIEEYWIADPDKKEVIVYYFKARSIADYNTFKSSETVRSFTFKELKIDLDTIFG